MSHARITEVAVSRLFWKDLSKWRTHPEYWTIRRQIGEMVRLAAAGEDPGDKSFQNSAWSGIRHMHVAAKLIVFTSRDGDGILQLNALKKHDFYGFRRERKKAVDSAVTKVRNAMSSEPVASPEWSGIKWTDPGMIAGHPELSELSRDALEKLLHDIHDEADSLAMLEGAITGMSTKLADRFADAWIDSLDEAMTAVEGQILALARQRKKVLPAAHVARWVEDLTP